MTNEEAIFYLDDIATDAVYRITGDEKKAIGLAISALRAQEKDHIANVGETAEPCECIIGLYYNSEDANLVTLKELKEKIKENKQYNEYIARNYSELSHVKLPEYSLRDYFDGRKSTNLTRFKHCPMCGRPLTPPKGEAE